MPELPPVIITCMPRSTGNLRQIIDSLELPTAELFQPSLYNNKRRTKCNKAAEAFADAMSVHMPKGLLARQQIEWLASPSSRLMGWFEVNSTTADDYAELGHPVFACWMNPIPEQSSHIAMMRSKGRIAQAGARNFNDGSIAQGFGDRQVRFFVCL